MCKGVTERNYFQGIKEDNDFKPFLSALDPLVVKAKHPSPVQVVSEAEDLVKKAKQDNNEYDQVWVVFDHDNHPNRCKAFEMAEKLEFNIAFSAIAFEAWYLLHFLQSAKAFQNCNELIRELKKFWPEYEKARQNDFLHLKTKIDTAISNAAWLKNQQQNNKNICDKNPWASVDNLINTLLEIGSNNF